MGALELRFEKRNLGTELNLGVVARVQQIKDAAGNYSPDAEDREVVIPAGAHASRTLDNIPVGTYRIEARLPSGEVLREIREVTAGQDAPVVFKTGQSPHEWLSWQRLAGNVPSQKEYEVWMLKLVKEIARAAAVGERTVKPADKAMIRRLAKILHDLHVGVQPLFKVLGGLAAKVGGGGLVTSTGDAVTQEPAAAEHPPEPVAKAEAAELELLQADPRIAVGLWEATASLPAWQAWRKTASSYGGCATERIDDREVTLWRIAQGERASCTVTDPNGRQVPLRCLAVMRRGDGVDVISLPVPWPLDSHLPAAGLEILREAGTSDSGRTMVVVRDEVIGGLMMYLSNGQIAEAATVLAEADQRGLIEELISEKAQNPLAACAAAYVGFATLSVDEKPRWVIWLVNLKDRFVWLPDGAIVYAAYRLKTARSRDDLKIALAALKEAYSRGIPFYTAGLQHLMNGLYTFSEKDAEAKAMYERVRAVASRVDPNQVFCLIAITAPPA